MERDSARGEIQPGLKILARFDETGLGFSTRAELRPGLKKSHVIETNLVPRAHVPFGQHQDTELWNNQFPETKILGLPASRRMRGLV